MYEQCEAAIDSFDLSLLTDCLDIASQDPETVVLVKSLQIRRRQLQTYWGASDDSSLEGSDQHHQALEMLLGLEARQAASARKVEEMAVFQQARQPVPTPKPARRGGPGVLAKLDKSPESAPPPQSASSKPRFQLASKPPPPTPLEAAAGQLSLSPRATPSTVSRSRPPPPPPAAGIVGPARADQQRRVVRLESELGDLVRHHGPRAACCASTACASCGSRPCRAPC